MIQTHHFCSIRECHSYFASTVAAKLGSAAKVNLLQVWTAAKSVSLQGLDSLQRYDLLQGLDPLQKPDLLQGLDSQQMSDMLQTLDPLQKSDPVQKSDSGHI